jgi:uncharacterized membrane protein
LKLHALRSAFYAVIFRGPGVVRVAWRVRRAARIAGGSEFALSLAGAVLADRTREVGLVEHVVHWCAGITTGAWAGFVFFTAFTQWMTAPTALAPMFYGWVSLALSDLCADSRLDRAARCARSPRRWRRAREIPAAGRARNRRIGDPVERSSASGSSDSSSAWRSSA